MNDTQQNLMKNIYNNKEAYLKEKKYSNSKYTLQYISENNYKLYNNNINTSKLNNSFPNKNNDFVYYDNTREKTLSKLNNDLIYIDNTRENDLSKLDAIPENNININNNNKNNNNR